MTNAGDVFAGFLNALVSGVSDHEVGTSDVAAQLGMSRSHFSRVVSAVAGEPPAAPRRRILLERAAYRLVTDDSSILDVAVECGYSSHEAFTRAFSAAYGVSPSQWRRSPARLQLDAPNGVHFHPPGSLLLPARRKVHGMDLAVRMLEHNVWLIDEMLCRAQQLPDETLDKRIELSVSGVDLEPTLRSLLWRLVGQLEMWNAAISGREYTWAKSNPSAMELRSRLAAVAPEFIGRIRDIAADGRLDESVICPGQDVEVYTYGGVVAHLITYAAHRRILAAGALNDAGFTELDEDPVRWISADTA